MAGEPGFGARLAKFMSRGNRDLQAATGAEIHENPDLSGLKERILHQMNEMEGQDNLNLSIAEYDELAGDETEYVLASYAEDPGKSVDMIVDWILEGKDPAQLQAFFKQMRTDERTAGLTEEIDILETFLTAVEDRRTEVGGDDSFDDVLDDMADGKSPEDKHVH